MAQIFKSFLLILIFDYYFYRKFFYIIIYVDLFLKENYICPAELPNNKKSIMKKPGMPSERILEFSPIKPNALPDSQPLSVDQDSTTKSCKQFDVRKALMYGFTMSEIKNYMQQNNLIPKKEYKSFVLSFIAINIFTPFIFEVSKRTFYYIVLGTIYPKKN